MPQRVSTGRWLCSVRQGHVPLALKMPHCSAEQQVLSKNRCPMHSARWDLARLNSVQQHLASSCLVLLNLVLSNSMQQNLSYCWVPSCCLESLRC